MPEPNGPGRYKATNGIKSSKCSGLRSITSLVIPSDSSWNTPDVSPFVRISQAALSSSGIASKSRSIPRFALMSFKASPITVNVRRPKKSIFKRPNSSILSLSYCVTKPSSLAFCTGTWSSRGSAEITTPAAWVDEFRAMPSSFLPKSNNSLTFGSASYKAFNSLPCKALSKVIPSSLGIIFAMRFTSASGKSSTRPTSRITARAASVPNVIIWDTRSCPYFRVTYSMAWPRFS